VYEKGPQFPQTRPGCRRFIIKLDEEKTQHLVFEFAGGDRSVGRMVNPENQALNGRLSAVL
jgi:hypothetical protein